MASDTQIASAALLKLGEEPITSFTEAGKPASLANNTYATYRDALMRAHPWNFAIRRVALAASSTTPVYGYDYAYPLPADPNYCLRVLHVEDATELGFQVEGRQIVSDLSPPLNITYIQRVTDPNLWDALFVEALVSKLAMEWAEPLAKDNALASRMIAEFEAKIATAFGVDGQEGWTEALPEGSWVQANR